MLKLNVQLKLVVNSSRSTSIGKRKVCKFYKVGILVQACIHVPFWHLRNNQISMAITGGCFQLHNKMPEGRRKHPGSKLRLQKHSICEKHFVKTYALK